MQNSIIKEFEDNPNVVAAVYNEGGNFGETLAWTQTLWENYYLRGGVIWDPTGDNSKGNYNQPDTGLPFGRAYIIDQQGRVALPYFGHNPSLAIKTIYGLLENTADLAIAKERIGAGIVAAGDHVTYTLTLTNNGYTTPVTATIVDTWTPTNAVIGVNAPGCDTSSWASGVITCTQRNLGENAISHDIVLSTNAAYSGTLTNMVSITPTGGITDYKPDNNIATSVAVVQNTCLAPVPPTLRIAKDGNKVLLDWDEHVENHEVEIWRGTDPFHTESFALIGTNPSTDTTFTDVGALGDHSVNYSYAVRGRNACDDTSNISNKVGEFDFRLNEDKDPAASASAVTGKPRAWHYALIALPFEGAHLPTTADGVAKYIDPGGSVQGVAKWNHEAQTWMVRRVGSEFGTPDFSVSPGDVLFIGMDDSAPDAFAWVGDVPAVGTIQNHLLQNAVNSIIVPLDQSGEFTMTAEGLAADIHGESGISGVTRVNKWSVAQQRWYIRKVGISGPDFVIHPGYAYHILTNSIPPSVWP